MRDKKHIWLDVLVVGVVVAQIVLCIAPRKPATPLPETDLSKLTPGNFVDVTIPGQSLRIEIPKGESKESGTFSLVPSKGTPIRGIHRDGRLETLAPKHAGNGITELVIMMRTLDTTPRISTLAFESSGYNFVPRKTPPVPNSNPEPVDQDDKANPDTTHKQFPVPTKRLIPFTGAKEVRTTN